MNDNSRPRSSNVQAARQRISRWPGWVWIVPIAAIGFVTWLAINSWLLGAPQVTVHFASAEGVTGGAPVKFRGMQVGRVSGVSLDDDLQGVSLTLSMDESMRGHLGAESQFWIVKPSLGSGQIRNIISGAYVAMQPGKGEDAQAFTGLEKPPVLDVAKAGREYVITAEDVGRLSPGAPVFFHGMQAGEVLGTEFAPDEQRTKVRILVSKPYDDFVRQATVFWRAGGISISKGVGGLNAQIPPLSTLMSGGIMFDTPTSLAGAPAKADATFSLHDSRASAESEAGGPRLAYFTSLPGAVGNLGPGSPVTLGGQEIGRVAKVGLSVDAKAGSMETPVTFVIDARQLVSDLPEDISRDDLRKRMNQAMAALVQNGLRAHVASGGVVLGETKVELFMADDAKGGQLDTSHEPPQIPSAAKSSGY